MLFAFVDGSVMKDRKLGSDGEDERRCSDDEVFDEVVGRFSDEEDEWTVVERGIGICIVGGASLGGSWSTEDWFEAATGSVYCVLSGGRYLEARGVSSGLEGCRLITRRCLLRAVPSRAPCVGLSGCSTYAELCSASMLEDLCSCNRASLGLVEGVMVT